MAKDFLLIKRRTLIVGAGKAGELLAEDIAAKKDLTFDIIGFLDDNKEVNSVVAGVVVLGRIAEIGSIAENLKVEEIIIALPSADGSVNGKYELRKRICTDCSNITCKKSVKMAFRPAMVIFSSTIKPSTW